jgi:SMI1/KNR4 family protein SUKH-1
MMKPWDRFQFNSAASHGCSPELLAKFESMIGVRLPGDYREFLLEVNGGRPTGRGVDEGKNSKVTVDWAGREPQEAAEQVRVNYLLVVEDWSNIYEDRRNEALTVFGSYQIFVADERALPEGLIPIGKDPGGSLFLLDVDGRQRGAVSFWAKDWYDYDRREIDPYHNVGFIAPTFSAFLDKVTFK